MASASTLSLNEPALVHTVKLKPMITGQISGRIRTSGISHIALASVYSEKTRLKKCWMKVIGERASKRDTLRSVQSRIAIYYVDIIVRMYVTFAL